MMSRLTRIGGFRSYWLICLIVPAALLLPVFTDQNWKPAPGLDDIQVTCAAVEAYAAGLDPYYVKNLKDTKLSYPYLPVTLDVFRPVCAGGLLQPHYRTVFLVIGAMAALLLTLGSSLSGRDIAVRILLVLGGFLGFEWTIFSGNFAVLTGLLTALVLALFQHGLWRRLHGQEAVSFGCFVVGAAVLGALTSVKVTFFPLLLALYLLPHPRRNKLVLIGVGLGCFIAPVLISCLLYNDLFFSWIAAITGQIPGQHSPVSEPCTPSLLCLGQALAEGAGLGEEKLIGRLMYGPASLLLVLAPLAVTVIGLVDRNTRPGDGSFLCRLDRLSVENPQLGLRLTTLAMFALYLCAPRVKAYAFFELGIYAAALVADCSAPAMAVIMTIAVMVPALAMQAPSSFLADYAQLMSAVFCFWVFLVELNRPIRVLGTPEAAQPLCN